MKRNIPKAQEIYRHFKGELYQIVTVAKHSETGELLVVYQALYGDFTVYARPLSLFMEKVDPVKYPEETREYRFVLQEPGSLSAATPDHRREVRPEAGSEVTLETGTQVRQETGTEVRPQAEDAGKEPDTKELPLDPLVIEYLDAGGYEERLNILSALHHRVTDDMVNVMAMAIDVEVPAGDVETRYTQLRECLLKLQKYECSRLR